MATTTESSIPDSEQVYLAPPLTVQQEDAIIHTRITNDEKALRRVTKKFHNYTSVAYTPIVPPSAAATTSVDDAREAFLVELASFHLSLKKSLMVCEAEVRQVEEYQREKERIAMERLRLKEQIEELKTSLEHAQLERKRKIEYDVVAEKVNSLPSREELERSISSLENDMVAIRAEQDTQNRIIQAQKSALDVVISDLGSLRLMGKQDATEVSRGVTPLADAPIIDITDAEDVEMDGSISARTREESGELKEDVLDNDRESEDDIPLAKTLLNPGARSFVSQRSRTSTPVLGSSAARSNSALLPSLAADEDDIEMGELAEEPRSPELKLKKKVREEELEEGEASDQSSELSEPPDD
ncbi:Tho complex subunit 7-domain-containing protein [Amylocystis lapponica]|nr:Tho complex subunit 7-domain-containing protein [Amylocystis lapponica]